MWFHKLATCQLLPIPVTYIVKRLPYAGFVGGVHIAMRCWCRPAIARDRENDGRLR
jgi:hypothetical protein